MTAKPRSMSLGRLYMRLSLSNHSEASGPRLVPRDMAAP
jgi:hypothetical protein